MLRQFRETFNSNAAGVKLAPRAQRVNISVDLAVRRTVFSHLHPKRHHDLRYL